MVKGFKLPEPEEVKRIANDVIRQYVETDNQFEKDKGYDNLNNPIVRESLKHEDANGRSADEYISFEITHNLVIRDWGENFNFDPKKFMESFLQTGGPELFMQIAESQPDFLEQYAQAVNEGNETQSGFLSESYLENIFTPSFKLLEEDRDNYIAEMKAVRSQLIFENEFEKDNEKNNRKDFFK